MQSVIEILQTIGVFLGGLLTRLGIFLAALALLALPALAIALALRAILSQKQRALGIRRVGGLLFRPGLFYAPGHTWLRPRGAGKRPGERAGTLEVGIDDLAQRLLPSVTAVELARTGAAVAQGEVVAALHGGGRAVRILSPISGTVAGVNAAILRDPSLVKRDGYGRGWLVAIAPSDPSFSDLPHGAAAEAWLEGESARWNRFVEDRLGFAAADGGVLVAPAPWLVGEDGWRQLTSSFLGG